MSIQSEIDRIEQNVADTYSVLSEAGAPMPAFMDSNNLAGTAANIAAVLYNAPQNLTDTQKAQARENIGVDENTVPSYWVSELETKATAIQEAMEGAGKNSSSFLWYTDGHWLNNSKKSPILLKYLWDNTPINKINYGGDIINDPTSFTHDNIKYAYEWREMIAKLRNHHSVVGNHDVFQNVEDVSNITYAFMIAHEESFDMIMGGNFYYYIDNPCEQTRYLYLSYMTSNHAAMVAQGQFICDAIKAVPEGWHIVAIAHRWWQYNSASDPTVGFVPTYETDILSVFDAYNARETRSGSNYFVAQDFTQAKGKVEFCIGGHLHVDFDFYSEGGIPIIITASDTNQNRVPDSTNDYGTLGTITESAVYGIIADYNDADNIKITVVGVGRGTSRVVRSSAVEPTSISDITYSGDTTVGATIDKSKFSFTVNYSNGTSDTVNGATSVSPATIEVVGDNTVTVTYTEGTTTLSGTATIVGTAAPVVRLLNLDRTYVAGTVGENIKNNLDESKAYINTTYASGAFLEKSCTVSGITENSVTIKEPGVGGTCVGYAVRLSDLKTQAYRISFDYSGSGKARGYYRGLYTENNAFGGTVGIVNASTAGESGHIDVDIPANNNFEWIVIFLGSNTGGTSTFENVSLTKA